MELTGYWNKKGEYMPFLWNDKRYFDRVSNSLKSEFKIFLPMLLVSYGLWWFFLEKDVTFFQLFLVSALSSAVIFTFISIFKQFPNPNIPEYYHPFVKKFMYIVQFFVACLGLYIILLKVIFVS